MDGGYIISRSFCRVLRKVVHDMDEIAAIEFLINKMKDTKTNAEFFESMKR